MSSKALPYEAGQPLRYQFTYDEGKAATRLAAEPLVRKHVMLQIAFDEVLAALAPVHPIEDALAERLVFGAVRFASALANAETLLGSGARGLAWVADRAFGGILAGSAVSSRASRGWHPAKKVCEWGCLRRTVRAYCLS